MKPVEEREADVGFMMMTLGFMLVFCVLVILLYFCYKCVARLCLISSTPTKITCKHCYESLCTFDCCLRGRRSSSDKEQDLEDGYGVASMMATKESEVPLRL